MSIKNRLLVGAFVAPLILTACSDSDGLLITERADSEQLSQGSHIPHTGPSDGVWPPQPEGMTNVEPYPSSARQGVLTGVLDAARSSIMNNPQVRSSLGSDYREIEASLGDSKSDLVASMIFYNYAADETIEVSLGDDGAIISEIYAASVYQPMEHPQEEEDAIALARSVLNNGGFDVSGLQPTAMLAFPSQSNVQSNAQHFYEQRVMYVTFGPGGGELPLYTALVDLSNASVVEHGLVK